MTSTAVIAQPLTRPATEIRPNALGESVGRALPTTPPSMLTLLGMVAPVGAFLLANAVWGLVPGMAAATATAVTASLLRLHRGQGIGWLSLALLGYVIARGAAGALTGSHQVFFGISVAASIAVAAGVLGTAFTRTPIAAHLLPALMRGRLLPETVRHPTYRRIASQITAVWAVAELNVAIWEAWHLSHADAVEFVTARGLIGWPVMAGIVFACCFYARFRIEWIQATATAAMAQRERHET